LKPPIILYEPPKRARTEYRIGLSAWTDKSMVEEGSFYPYMTMSSEERLWWYSRFFDTVEVNSTFYALPSPDTTALWVARTQPGFVFNVKAYGLLTGHHVDAARLPQTLRKLLAAATQSKQRGRVPSTSFGEDARVWTFSELRIRPGAAPGGQQARLRSVPARAVGQALGRCAGAACAAVARVAK
jgi:uncharacterized protein YecE (DUF72 family)